MNSLLFVRGVGGIGLLVLGCVLWAMATAHFAGLQKRPMLAIELAASKADLHAVLDPGPNVEQAKNQLFIDWFFIGSYWLFFLGTSALLRSQPQAALSWRSACAALLATGTAFFDLHENLGIRRSLAAFPDRLSDLVIGHTRQASIVKWLLFFVLVLWISQLFLLRPDWTRGIGILLAAAGLIGVVGLASGVRQPLIGLGLLITLIGLLGATVFWLLFPAHFLNSA